jgi:hypothetical protein
MRGSVLLHPTCKFFPIDGNTLGLLTQLRAINCSALRVASCGWFVPEEIFAYGNIIALKYEKRTYYTVYYGLFGV